MNQLRVSFVVAFLCLPAMLLMLASPSSVELDRLRGGNAMVAQCPIKSCISANPNANSTGSEACTQVGDPCTSCRKVAGSEDYYMPIDMVGVCNGIRNQKQSDTKDCDLTQGEGTCAVDATTPWGFKCDNMVSNNKNCLPANMTIYEPKAQ